MSDGAKPELVWVDSFGWPVTYFRNRPVVNFIRTMLHGRKRVWWLRVEGGLRQIDWDAVAAVPPANDPNGPATQTPPTPTGA